jgi:hypothetical protein
MLCAPPQTSIAQFSLLAVYDFFDCREAGVSLCCIYTNMVNASLVRSYGQVDCFLFINAAYFMN